jgi:glutamate dehydrogenase (NAD(P)+)
MGLIKDTYKTLYGHRDINAAAVTTGKAVSQLGIRGRAESTGLGVFYATRQIISDAKMA